MNLSEEQKQYLLDFNVFDGDFGSPGDICLMNKIVVARKANKCSECGEVIKQGTYNLVKKMKWESDGLMSYRFCEDCCFEILSEHAWPILSILGPTQLYSHRS